MYGPEKVEAQDYQANVCGKSDLVNISTYIATKREMLVLVRKTGTVAKMTQLLHLSLDHAEKLPGLI